MRDYRAFVPRPTRARHHASARHARHGVGCSLRSCAAHALRPHRQRCRGRMTAQIRPRVPLVLKLAYTTFIAVLIPVYWHYYGPTNFLYFCDVALILTLGGLWIESPLLISMCAVGILLPQILWMA